MALSVTTGTGIGHAPREGPDVDLHLEEVLLARPARCRCGARGRQALAVGQDLDAGRVHAGQIHLDDERVVGLVGVGGRSPGEILVQAERSRGPRVGRHEYLEDIVHLTRIIRFEFFADDHPVLPD